MTTRRLGPSPLGTDRTGGRSCVGAGVLGLLALASAELVRVLVLR